MEDTVITKRNPDILVIENQREEEMNKHLYDEIKVDINTSEKKQRNVKKKDDKSFQGTKYIYYVLGVLEVFFAFRFIFKILGANLESTFVSFVYSATNLFLTPFTGIFRMAVSEGIETKSVLEPTLIIGMIVYALLAWGVVKLIEIIANKNDPTTL